jgi:two-component system, sensor histidine kinase
MAEPSKILIVDDKHENLFALEKALQPLGALIVKAQSGSEALQKSMRHEFALAIVDVLMPGMDGYELVRLLRGQEETRSLPVIFLTAILADEAFIAKGYQSGAVDFLTKPVNMEVLLSKARVFLELDRNRRALMRQKTALVALGKERDRLNRELTAERDMLERRVRERTLELERANRIKDEFLANMSHEIRTPMSGVFGMIDVILRQPLPDHLRNDLELARSSASTVLSLLNDLLDLSRIEQGKLELSIRRSRIREMLERLVQTYELQAVDRDISFGLDVDDGVPELVLCDPDRLGQVLKNLLSNALKFTERGEIRMSVRRESMQGEADRLRFFVTDTGIGIPPEKAEEVFVSFTQLDPTFSKKFSGAGLGLAISRRLVELMGGEISVKSEVGMGASFSFSIRFEEARDGFAEEPKPALALADLPSLSILLAEDNPVNRLFLKRALTGAGHEVEEAENGLEALEKMAKRPFDVVLMDIQMPEMDGLEAARRIRSEGNGASGVPIIALTAYAMKGDRERFLRNGMDGYVTKPVDFAELAGEIAAACSLNPRQWAREHREE